MSKTAVIVQARMDSKRLPGKMALQLGERTVLEQVLHQLGHAKSIDSVITATTTDKLDDALEEISSAKKIPVFRGSVNDVLDRYYQCAKSHKCDVIVRVTGDCPLIDPQVLDAVVEKFKSGSYDYVSNVHPPTYPDGYDVEVFSMSALEKAWKSAQLPSEREHVTQYFVNHPEDFRSGHIKADSDFSHLRLTIDQPEDYRVLSELFSVIGKKGKCITLSDVTAALKKKPEILNPNSNIVRNEGLQQSLKGDIKQPGLQLKSSRTWFERAQKVIPGCAQTFSKGYTQYVQGVCPIFLERGKGSYVWDVDGNKYIDYVQGLLPNILGYAEERVNNAVIEQIKNGHSFSLPHTSEVELAEKLCEIIPCAEMVRYGKNGSDATSAAVRLARSYTKRDLIACCGYHGWHDWYIGSTARSLGVPEAVRALTKTFRYNDLDSLRDIFEKNSDQVAGVIMEPVNFIEPQPGFLEGVRELATKHGAVLIFDEICTGWHLGLGGAQKLYGVTPDLACFGKAMGNGFPISAVLGKADIMRLFNDVFVSFTFAGEAASIRASLEVIKIIESEPVIEKLKARGTQLKQALLSLSKSNGLEKHVKCIGFPQWSLIKFLNSEGTDWLPLKSLFQQEVVSRGILTLGTHNLNYSLSQKDVEQTIKVYGEVLPILKRAIESNSVEKAIRGKPIEAIFKVR